MLVAIGLFAVLCMEEVAQEVQNPVDDLEPVDFFHNN